MSDLGEKRVLTQCTLNWNFKLELDFCKSVDVRGYAILRCLIVVLDLLRKNKYLVS